VAAARPTPHNLRVNRSTLKAVGQYGVGLALLTWVVSRNWRPESGEPGLAETFELPFHAGIYALAAVLTAISAWISFTRWYLLVRAQNLPFRYVDALRLGLAGFFFNTFLPGSIGGDIVKAAGIARSQERRTVAVATVLMDRVIGLWGLLLLLALSGVAFTLAGNRDLLGNADAMLVVRAAWVAAAASVAAWLLLGLLPERGAVRFAGRLDRVPKLGGVLAEFWRAVWTYRKTPRAVYVAIGMSLACHTINVASFHLASRAFGDAAEGERLPSLAEHYSIVPVGLTFQAFVPTPGGLGFGEMGYGGLYYRVLHRPRALGVRASLVQRTLMWSLGLVGYLTYLRMKHKGAVRPLGGPDRAG
jgi:uncharacterized protein (TIRG00374 family)